MSIRELLKPGNAALLLIDHQQEMASGVQSLDVKLLKLNTICLAKTARTFKVPTIYTSIKALDFSGSIWPELLEVFPEQRVFERTSLNCWDDSTLVDAIMVTRRKKLIVAGLWTEACVSFPTIQALAEGYEVYIVNDASGSTSSKDHEISMHRMMQVGAVPVTWRQVLLEFQSDWAREETANAVLQLLSEHRECAGSDA